MVQIQSVTIKPDFVFPNHRLAVFVDGPPSHEASDFALRASTDKTAGQVARDHAQDRLLRRSGWRVVRIWEHGLTAKNMQRTVVRLTRALLSV